MARPVALQYHVILRKGRDVQQAAVEKSADDEMEAMIDQSQGQELLRGKGVKNVGENLVSDQSLLRDMAQPYYSESRLTSLGSISSETVGSEGDIMSNAPANTNTSPPSQQIWLQVVGSG